MNAIRVIQYIEPDQVSSRTHPVRSDCNLIGLFYGDNVMPNRINAQPGDRYGLLVIVSEMEKRGHRRQFLCICDCENSCEVALLHLRNGHTKSCGCLNTARITKHGLRKSPLYGVWWLMKRRCYDSRAKDYSDYGGRGITVCDEWFKIIPFYEWSIANGYKKGLTLDRIDNDKGYSPHNCRWATAIQQHNNTRSNVYLYYNGKKMTAAQWARELNIKPQVIYSRINAGWSTNMILGTPARRYSK